MNTNWSINAAHIYRNKSIFPANAGDRGVALAAIDRSIELIGAVLTEDAPQWYSTAFGQALAWRMDLLGARAATSDAERLDALLAAAIQTDVLDSSRFIGDAALALARFERGRGRLSRSGAILHRGIGALTPLVDTLPVAALISLAALQVEISATRRRRERCDKYFPPDRKKVRDNSLTFGY